MGYNITLHNYDFIIAAAEKNNVLQALHNMPDINYSWVSIAEVKKTQTLDQAMYEWRYKPEYDEGGNVIGIDFCGEKLGSDEEMFAAIAPFVKHGSFIEMHGEDGAMWRWKFVNGQMKEISAKIIWDDE